jgi:uncharacterized alpha/beta hydrolase family protein
MKDKNKFLLIGIIIALVLVFILFWYSQPVKQEVNNNTQLDSLTTQLQNRSNYGTLPIVFSASQVGKDNPFK